MGVHEAPRNKVMKKLLLFMLIALYIIAFICMLLFGRNEAIKSRELAYQEGRQSVLNELRSVEDCIKKVDHHYQGEFKRQTWEVWGQRKGGGDVDCEEIVGEKIKEILNEK